MIIKSKIQEPTIDYRQCEKERITRLGTIQSYGGLLVIQHFEVIAHSKNIHSFLSSDLNHFLHQKVSEVSPALYELLGTILPGLKLGKTSFQTLGQWIVGFRKEENDFIYAEFFPQPTHLVDINELDEEIDLLGRRFYYPVKDRSQFLDEVCHIFQKFLRFDQIFVQIIQDSEIMEVVAEANSGKLEPVLGLHFSSKEIPSQARTLYLKQRIRFKQESRSTPVEIVCDANDSINLTHCLLREPSKFMTVYMQNMSASTLLSTSIIIDKELTGILTMHNASPLFLDPRVFDRIVEIVHRISLEILRIDDLIKKNANSKLWELLMQDFPLNRLGALQQLITSPRLEKSLDYTGAVVAENGKQMGTSGECPIPQVIEAIVKKNSNKSGSTNFSSKLSEDFDLPTTLLGEFAGMMSIKFEDISILFFRKKFHLALKWRIPTPENLEESTNLPRFSPAGSFQFLLQEFQNQSRPWSEKDIAFASVLEAWISEEFES